MLVILDQWLWEDKIDNCCIYCVYICVSGNIWMLIVLYSKDNYNSLLYWLAYYLKKAKSRTTLKTVF